MLYLEQPGSAALRGACLHQAVVLTPHSRAHALYANKRHLALFSDAARLQALKVPQAVQNVLLEQLDHWPEFAVTLAVQLGGRSLVALWQWQWQGSPIAGPGS